MIRRPPRSTRVRSSAASDVYKRQLYGPLFFLQFACLDLVHHLDRVTGADLGADAAALAVLEVDVHHLVILHPDGRVRAGEKTDHAVVALLPVAERALGAPAAGLVIVGVAGLGDGGSDLVPAGSPFLDIADVPLLFLG